MGFVNIQYIILYHITSYYIEKDICERVQGFVLCVLGVLFDNKRIQLDDIKKDRRDGQERQ